MEEPVREERADGGGGEAAPPMVPRARPPVVDRPREDVPVQTAEEEAALDRLWAASHVND